MNLTMNHDTRRLQAIPGDELARYIDGCMTRAYAEGRNGYRAEIHAMLEDQARGMRGREVLRMPLPVDAEFCIGEATRPVVAERMTWVEFTADQIRAFSHFLTGIRARTP